ncbi:ABC transporter substrate-binding protein [Herbiconiux sp. VKM Ac-2851]|uniref:ABC transporter substrate-binding protein n=1 Tax=Herbiconiux sp. VKM Ac-2851 TaxID=2739025 RepID=UPI001564E2D7|nr:ABC transporter substrate-binding protein [Herbiconiux sp. VKM Ac-2851]NQX35614.1 ABC transporter substrate-binding protein [Herbiconiux sp. VKM Ac-2851]
MSGLTKGLRAGVAAVGVIAAAVALAGCANGASASDDAAAAGADCAETTPAHLVIGTADLDVSYIPYGILANELGYFAEECIDMTIDAAADGLLQSLTSGQADFVMSSPSESLFAGNGAPMGAEMIYNLIPDLNISLAVLDDSALTSVGDLKGAVIGTWGLGPYADAYVSRSLELYGLTLDDVTIIETGYGTTPMQALDTGEVDAVLYWPGLYTSWELAGYPTRVLEGTEWSSTMDGIGILTTDTIVADDPELVEGVSRAIAKSTVYLRRFPESAVRAFWAGYPERAPLPGEDETAALEADLAILDSTLVSMGVDDRPDDTLWGDQTAERWQNQIDYFVDTGMIAPTGEVVPDTFFSADHIPAANDFDHDAIVEQK